MDWSLALGCVGYLLLQILGESAYRARFGSLFGTHQLLENALVQPPLFRPAVPELLVVVLQTLPVGPELGEAVLVDVLDTAILVSLAPSLESWCSYTLAAQRVTLRPSFMQSSSPRPPDSVLHIM